MECSSLTENPQRVPRSHGPRTSVSRGVPLNPCFCSPQGKELAWGPGARLALLQPPGSRRTLEVPSYGPDSPLEQRPAPRPLPLQSG